MSTDNKNDDLSDIEVFDLDNNDSNIKFGEIAKEVKKTMDEVKKSDYVDNLPDKEIDEESTKEEPEIKEFAHKEEKKKIVFESAAGKAKSAGASVGKKLSGFGGAAKGAFKGISGKAKDLGSSVKNKGAKNTLKDLYNYFLNNKLKCLKIAGIIVAVVIVIAIVAGVASNSLSSRRIAQLADQTEFTIDDNEEITELVKKYYTAIIAADVDSLSEILDDASGITKEDLQQTLVEGYKNIKCFIADGLEEDEYALFVYWEVKIYNIDTLAPGVASMYIYRDSDTDTLKIKTKIEDNSNIKIFLSDLANNAEIETLFNSTNQELNKALEQDASLKLVYDAMTKSIDNKNNSDSKETTETKETSETSESKETTETTTK